MGKSQRVKGHSFERWVARWFRDKGYEAERNLEYAAGVGIDVVAWRELKTVTFDTKVSKPKKILFGAKGKTHLKTIQCKVGQQVPKTIYKWFDEIQNSPNETPLLIVKRDRKKPLVVMSLEDYEKLL